MSKQSKKGPIYVEFVRTCGENERVSLSGARETVHKQTVVFHVESEPPTNVGDSPRTSPYIGSQRHVLQREMMTSSQESLCTLGVLQSQEHQKDSAGDFNDGECVEYPQGSPTANQTEIPATGSPEKSPTDRVSHSDAMLLNSSFGSGLDVPFASHSTPHIPSLFDKKSDSMSDSLSDKDRTQTLPALRHPRERSFERSLDNILDKCSEKSLDLSLSVDSWNGTVSEGGSRPLDSTQSSSMAKNVKSDKKKKTSWYTMLSPTYKSRSDDFKKTFKDIPKEERLIVDYSCAMQKDILVQGRMYISQNWICFYANIFRWETVLTIPCKDITAITKEKTARVIPNAIQITTTTERYFFTSFGARDKTYMMLFRIWQNALLDQPMPSKELWQWIHYNYGDELGLTSSDDDYVPPPGTEELREKLKDNSINQKDLTDSSDQPPPNDSQAVASNEDTDALVSDEVFNQSPSSHTAAPILPNIPTDFGDTSDDSDGEVMCVGHDHLEKLYLDEVFGLNVDKMFENMFSDSPFFRMFVGSRKTFDLNLPKWQEDPDEEGNKVRNISYTLTLNNSIGPRTAPTTERQICYKESMPGKMYCVDCEIGHSGIPYSDSFYVVLRYCLTRVSRTKCRVRITSELKFRKHVMGMIKGMIEKSAVNGLTDNFRCLSAHMRREAERQELHLPGHQLPKKKLRRRRKPHASVSDSLVQPRLTADRQVPSAPPSPIRDYFLNQEPPQPVQNPTASTSSRVSVRDDGTIKLNADMLVRVLAFILILLVMFNAMLFYKLWALEASTSGLLSMYSDDEINNLMEQPRSQEEWAQLLRQQRSLHENEVEKWRQILYTSVELMDHMKKSLLDLHGRLDVRLQRQAEEDSAASSASESVTNSEKRVSRESEWTSSAEHASHVCDNTGR